MPIEKEKPSAVEARLYQRLQLAELAKEGQGEAWKTRLANDLNTILARAQYHLEQDADESDIDFARAVLRVVGRVAEFEGIRRSVKAPLTPANCPVCIRRAK